MNNLHDRITTIIKAIAEADPDYWNYHGELGVLDQDAVVADVMAAVEECDGEVLEVFGGA